MMTVTGTTCVSVSAYDHGGQGREHAPAHEDWGQPLVQRSNLWLWRGYQCEPGSQCRGNARRLQRAWACFGRCKTGGYTTAQVYACGWRCCY